MNMGKVLIACEKYQRICVEFRKKGIQAFSCDISPCKGSFPQYHLQKDCLEEAYSGKYSLMIAHPPCKYLAFSGTNAWNNPGRILERLKALEFFAKLWLAPIKYICLENPRSCASPVISKYTQKIQPYQFGDYEQKETWLWLKNLPPLQPTNIVYPKIYKYFLAKNKKIKKIYFSEKLRKDNDRSKTFPSIARAMATQWHKFC